MPDPFELDEQFYASFGIPTRCACGERSVYAIGDIRSGDATGYCLSCATPEVVAACEQIPIMIRNGIEAELLPKCDCGRPKHTGPCP